MRVHIVEVQLPSEENDVREMVRQMHKTLGDCSAGHLDTAGHSVLPLDEEEDVIFGKKFMDVLGESGATFYLRGKFRPERFPNWGVNNEGIMDAFYHKKSLKLDGTVSSLRCGDEWVSNSA